MSINAINPFVNSIFTWTTLSADTVNIVMDYIPPQVAVAYKKNLSREQLVDAIGRVENPQVVLFYIGEYGFREEGVNYYKKDIKKIMQQKNQASCCLYDLTAWGALKDPTKRVGDFNPNVAVINDFALPRITSLPSSRFFFWLQAERDAKIISYMNETILKRDFIKEKSKGRAETAIIVAQLFNQTVPALEAISLEDCNTQYSTLQYVEGLFLVDQLVAKTLANAAGCINIVFALPNDEWKYYEDQNNSFAADIAFMIERRYGRKAANLQINVMFYTFKWGLDPTRSRPYNAGNKNIDVLRRSQIM